MFHAFVHIGTSLNKLYPKIVVVLNEHTQKNKQNSFLNTLISPRGLGHLYLIYPSELITFSLYLKIEFYLANQRNLKFIIVSFNAAKLY